MQRLQILSCATVDEVWPTHLMPWIRRAGAVAWKSRLPTVVVTPTRAHAVQLLRRLSAEAVALFNVRFWSVSELAQYLATRWNVGELLNDADLRMLARCAAERAALVSPDDVSIRTLTLAPEPLLEIVRILEAGGWGASEIEGSSFRRVAEGLSALLATSSLRTAGQRMFEIERAAGADCVIESLAVVGFDAAHFAFLPLVKASIRSARSALAVIPEIGERAESHDMAWAGTLEALGGEMLPFGDSTCLPLHSLAASFDQRDAAAGFASSLPVDFFSTRDDGSQAHAIARHAAALAEKSEGVVAVVAPQNGPLAREVSLVLAAAQIPHYCSLSPVSTAAEGRAWTALLDLLREPKVERMVVFAALHALPSTACACGQDELVDALRRAADILLLSKLSAVGHMLAGEEGATSKAVGRFLLQWPQIPERATLEVFTAQVVNVSDNIGLGNLGRRMERALASLAELATTEVSREVFCDWARASVMDPCHAPPADSAHPAARIHVLRLHEAVGTAWAHVIFAGQNEGVFPSPVRHGLFSEEVLAQLNQQVHVLNESATAEGYAGEGQLVVRDGKSLCLGPLSRRAIEVRDFLRVLSAARGASFYVSLRDPVRPGALLQPGSFVSRIHFLVRGVPLSVESAARLRHGATLTLPVETDCEADHAREAFVARRDTASPSGPYDFCLDRPAGFPVRIGASEWSRALSTPALQWMKSYIGVSASRRRTEMPWTLALGVWVHDWLKPHGRNGVFVPNPGKGWTAMAEEAAGAFRTRATVAVGGSTAALPLWWISLWGQALDKTRLLADSLSAVQHPYVAGELAVSHQRIAVPGAPELPVGGRLDLVFSDRNLAGSQDFGGANLLVVDHKTGADKPLSLARMSEGEGIQIGLYGLRVLQGNAASAGLCILKPGEAVTAQVSAADAAKLETIWSTIAAMLSTGAFGQIEAVRNEHGAGAQFPLATLAVPAAVLEARRRNLARLTWGSHALAAA